MSSLNPADLFKFFQSNGNRIAFFDSLKSEIKPIAQELNLQKVDSIFKLIYRLLVYSAFGFFVKVLLKVLKF
ncbi:MAG: hypothetical protein A3B68_00535 [Candidatus Melainabacteria bacterium RIFCSPHIGHO2_02_FULL_34_12]|nr:MAG: hypothetical protein A3B68_00535 [Candidatus Melainabacteria bacterium RIFCSPHIGHO2_02_FULL_34_12]